MSLFSTIRSPDRSPLRRDRSSGTPRSRLTDGLAGDPGLPRHLLVSLAGITAEVAALQGRCVDEPELQGTVDTILDRLDGLVESIYERAAYPPISARPRSRLATGSRSDALASNP